MFLQHRLPSLHVLSPIPLSPLLFLLPLLSNDYFLFSHLKSIIAASPLHFKTLCLSLPLFPLASLSVTLEHLSQLQPKASLLPQNPLDA